MTGQDHLEYLARRRRTRLAVVLSLGIAAIFCFLYINRASRQRWLLTAPISALEQAAQKHPEDTELIYRFAYRLIGEGRVEESLSLMERVVRREPRSLLYRYGYARAADYAGRYLEAARSYQKAIELDPTFAEAHAGLSALYGEAGLETDALREFEQTNRLNPSLPVDYALWARCLIHKGRLEEAWDKLRRSVQQNPVQNRPYPLLAEVGIKLKRYQETEAILIRRIDLTQAYPVGVARAPLVRVMLAQSPDRETLKMAEEVAEIAVTDPAPKADYWAVLGQVRLLRRNLEGSRRALEAGLKLEPDHLECLRLLATVYERQARAEQAASLRARIAALTVEAPEIAALRKRVRAAPGDAEARLALATALMKADRPAEGAEECLEALHLAPKHPGATTLLETCRTEALRKLERSSGTTSTGRQP